MEKIIEVNNLYKIYGEYDTKFEALKNINLYVKKGEFLGVMGPSGSGKSTLINILATLDMHTKGKVYINDKMFKERKDIRQMHNVNLSEFRKNNIGFIFQNYNLLEEFTNRENITLPLTLRDISDEEVRTRVEKLSKILEIEDILDKYPNNCSGGEKQRVAIARALGNNPKIIFADEPTDSLDVKIGLEVLQILKKLNKEEGITIILVTHSEMMASFCERILVIEQGEIRSEMKNTYLNQFNFYNEIVNENSKKMERLLECN